MTSISAWDTVGCEIMFSTTSESHKGIENRAFWKRKAGRVYVKRRRRLLGQLVLLSNTGVDIQESLKETDREFAKKCLAKFNGCSSDKFTLHFKEYKWQYNQKHKDLQPLIKKLFFFAKFS